MYNPYEKTALTRKTLSKPAKIVRDMGLLQGSILNMGCGNNGDTVFLKKEGYEVVGYDKYNKKYNVPELLKGKYETIICFYVFNVIQTLVEHEELLKQIRELGDCVYIAVRADKKAIKDNWEYINTDKVYKTSTGSYQRFYDEKLIEELFGEVEYIKNDNSLKLFKIK